VYLRDNDAEALAMKLRMIAMWWQATVIVKRLGARDPLAANYASRKSKIEVRTQDDLVTTTASTSNTQSRKHGCRKEQASLKGKEGSQEEDRHLR
jgi:hypothetical protein